MGQSSCQYFTRENKSEMEQPVNNSFKHCFSEGKTLVLDYSGLFHSVYSLTELIGKVRHIFPYNIKCCFDRKIDEKHSYVMLTCVHLSKHRIEYIGFEICFKKELQLIISIFPYTHSRLQANEPGSLELSYDFPSEKQFKHNISTLFEWIIEQKDFSDTSGKAGDVGKEIYYLIKNIIPSD